LDSSLPEDSLDSHIRGGCRRGFEGFLAIRMTHQKYSPRLILSPNFTIYEVNVRGCSCHSE
jgi:hypothetical protein